MRVTIEHREERLLGGGRNFFVDCTVLLSEAEKAVIRNADLGEHFVRTDSAVAYRDPTLGRQGLEKLFGVVGFIATLAVIPLLGLALVGQVYMRTFVIALLISIVAFVYPRYREWVAKRSFSHQDVSLADLMKKPKFTVYALDAYNAKKTEENICTQLADLKQRIVFVAPGLAQKQVYRL
jgi:hypothetical protein